MLQKYESANLLQQAPLEVEEKAIYMVFLTIFIDILATTISTPVMPFYAKKFGASKKRISWLFSAYAFSSTVFAPVLGKLSDQYGRRPILITALIGAGIANLFQGLSLYTITMFSKHIAFYIFGFFRGSSGIFAAIGTVTNVYIQDVVPKPLLPEYMAKMSVVGPLAFTFGPGMGGGLASIGGPNLPIMVDGIITLFSAVLVFWHLPETPAFLKLKESQAEGSSKPGGAKEDVKMEWQVYVLSAASFFGGLTMSAFVSMLALFLNEVYSLDVLHVTYVMVGNAVTLVLTGMFIAKRVKDCFGLRFTIVLANTIGGCIYMFMASCQPLGFSVWYFVGCIWFNSVFSSVAGASTGPLLSEFTVTANRGKVNSTSQLLMNFGRMLGPMIYGELSELKIEGIPGFSFVWALAGLALWIKAFLTLFVKPKPVAPSALKRGETKYGAEWQDEAGSKEDQAQMGKFVVDLLTKGHYKWVTRRAEVETLLCGLLPELTTTDKDEYEKQFHSVEMTSHEFSSNHK